MCSSLGVRQHEPLSLAMPLVLRENIETLEDFLINQCTEIIEAIAAAHPELIFDFSSVKAGTETVVIGCSLKGEKYVLRVRKKGLENELAAYQDLQGIEGVPCVRNSFQHDGKTVAILVDFIDGPTVLEFLQTASWEEIVALILDVRSLVRRVHKRNCLMPADYCSVGNIRLDQSHRPYLVDIGDYEHSLEPPDDQQLQRDLSRIYFLTCHYPGFQRTPQLETARNCLREFQDFL